MVHPGSGESPGGAPHRVPCSFPEGKVSHAVDTGASRTTRRRDRDASIAVGVIGTAVAAQATSTLKSGQTVYFIPKDTLNPYEVIADRGGKLALDEDRQQAGRPVRHEGHRGCTAAGDPDRHPDRRQRDRDRGQRPGGPLPAAQAGDGQGHRGRRVRLRRELPPALHQPGRHRDDRPQPDPGARQGDGLQGRVRDPLGRLHGDQPERLDQVHEGRAEAAQVQEHEARQDLLRQRRPDGVAAGDGEHAAGVSEPQGHRVARRPSGISSAAQYLSTLEVQGQGRRCRASGCRAR